MSGYLKWRDTTIIILAVVGNIIGQFLTASMSQIWVLYLAYILWMLWNTITTISRSSMTKFMESNEVGKAFSVLGIIQSLLPLATKPFFSFFYRDTLDTFPGEIGKFEGMCLTISIAGAFRILTGSLYILVLLLLIYTHFGMKKHEARMEREKQTGEEMVKLNNSSDLTDKRHQNE